MTRYNADLPRTPNECQNNKKQRKITISFDQQDDDLYFALMRQSTRHMAPISKLSRHWMRGGINLQIPKQLVVA